MDKRMRADGRGSKGEKAPSHSKKDESTCEAAGEAYAADVPAKDA